MGLCIAGTGTRSAREPPVLTTAPAGRAGDLDSIPICRATGPLTAGDIMLKIIQGSSFVRSLATAAAALALMTVAAAPASAWPVDHPKVVGPHLDFGSNWNGVLGEPTDGGNLYWDTTGGVVTPTLSGRLFMNNVDGLRGRLRIDYYDAADNRITLRHSMWRTASPGFNAFDFVD